MTYTWTTFDLDSALSGTLVGFQQTDSYDLSCTGNLVGPGPVYTVKFLGYTLKVLSDGTVNKVTPANASWLNQTLQMVTAEMGSTGATATGTVPVQTKITEMPNVTLNGTPSVNVANTPSVNVANSPSVSVSNMPSEPIEIEGTVTIAEPEPSA